MDKKLYTIIVHSENFAGLLNQVTAVFTRRQINIESLNVSASSIKGVHQYTITAWTDKDTIEKVTKQITKKIDVLQAHYFTDDEIYQHEIALYKITTPTLEEKPEVSKVIRKYNARIVEVNAVFAIVEKNGMSEEITNLYEELRQLDCVLQFVRSGRVAITTSCFERVNEYLAADHGSIGQPFVELCGFPCQRPRFWHRDSKRGQLYLGIVPSGCRTG